MAKNAFPIEERKRIFVWQLSVFGPYCFPIRSNLSTNPEQDTMIAKGNTGVVMPLSGGDRIIKAPVPWSSDYLKRFQREQLRREINVYRHLPPRQPASDPHARVQRW